jgi:hypothetical protein
MSGDEPQRVWITNASTNVEAVINPVIAACDQGFVPDRVHLLENPSVDEEGDEALAFIDRTVETYDGDATLDSEMLEDERNFEAIVAYYRNSIEAATNSDSGDNTEVAIDVTPGRKFMSALAFQAGMRFEADHVFYLYLESSTYYDRLFPELPATGVDLMDFTEVFS